MSKPRVSVLTPTYNHQEFIGACIRSVIDQSFQDWEMIIVDDGSTDATAERIKAFGDPRIRYVHQKNLGIARLKETYNKGLELAQGEVVAILEGDDYWPPYKLQLQTPDFDNSEVVLSSGLTRIDMGSPELNVTPRWIPDEEVANNRPVGRAAARMMRPDSLTYTFPVSTMIRTEALRRVGGFQQPEYLPLVDYPTILRMVIEGEWRFHPYILGCWRRHPSSVTYSRLSEILENAYRYTFEFIATYRDRLCLTDEELDRIEELWDETAVNWCFLRGRMLAETGQRKQAADAFHQALMYRHTKRVKTVVGVASLLTRLGLPVEFLYKLRGRENWKKQMTLDTNDTVVSPRDMERPRYVGRWRKT